MRHENIYIGVGQVFRKQWRFSNYFYAFAATPPFGLLSVSQEFCFYTMQYPRSPSVPCHWSQRAHSIEQVGDNVILAYAANDCHSKVTVLPLKQVLSMLGLCPHNSDLGARDW